MPDDVDNRDDLEFVVTSSGDDAGGGVIRLSDSAGEYEDWLAAAEFDPVQWFLERKPPRGAPKLAEFPPGPRLPDIPASLASDKAQHRYGRAVGSRFDRTPLRDELDRLSTLLELEEPCGLCRALELMLLGHSAPARRPPGMPRTLYGGLTTLATWDAWERVHGPTRALCRRCMLLLGFLQATEIAERQLWARDVDRETEKSRQGPRRERVRTTVLRHAIANGVSDNDSLQKFLDSNTDWPHPILRVEDGVEGGELQYRIVRTDRGKPDRWMSWESWTRALQDLRAD